jgi:hypothetical protein
VFLDGKPAGTTVPFIARRHVHRAVPQAARPEVNLDPRRARSPAAAEAAGSSSNRQRIAAAVDERGLQGSDIRSTHHRI